jgi:hypothetical protein
MNPSLRLALQIESDITLLQTPLVYSEAVYEAISSPFGNSLYYQDSYACFTSEGNDIGLVISSLNPNPSQNTSN